MEVKLNKKIVLSLLFILQAHEKRVFIIIYVIIYYTCFGKDAPREITACRTIESTTRKRSTSDRVLKNTRNFVRNRCGYWLG